MKLAVIAIFFGLFQQVIAENEDSRPVIQYSKVILLANEFFDHQKIERLGLKKWIGKTGIGFGTSYTLQTELMPEGLLLEFTVRGYPYLVREFYLYVLANVDLMIYQSPPTDRSQLEKYKKSSEDLRREIEEIETETEVLANCEFILND